MQEENKTTQRPGLVARVWRSIISSSLYTESGNSGYRGAASSLILHARPVSVPSSVLRYTHTFGLGGMALVLIMMLMGTGLLMIFVYEPSPERAYQSVLYMQEQILFGRLIRGIHYWSANLLIAVAVLHMLRVFLTGAFHGLRRSNWLLGLGLLFLIFVAVFAKFDGWSGL